MNEAPELEASLWAEAARAGVAVRPVVLPTPWRVGPVTAYLMPGDPVTLIDAGYDTPEARKTLSNALSAAGRSVSDVRLVVCTHGHTDHFGCARWLQEESGCRVVMHPDDAERLRPGAEPWSAAAERMFVPLGVPAEAVRTWFSRNDDRWDVPQRLDPILDGDELDAGGTTLEVLHRPGHTPGHVWLRERQSGAIFVGDYVLATGPTNAGLEADPADPVRRRPMLELYNNGLAELAEMAAPVLFPAHGPAITSHRALIERRLAKTKRRTEHVAAKLAEAQEVTVFELAAHMYGERLAANPYGFMADVAGRLDALVARGSAEEQLRDGIWYYRVRNRGPETTGGSHG